MRRCGEDGTDRLTSRLRRLLPALGPGYLVAVGFVDPGNWATDIAAGARYHFALLSVVLAASVAAAFLQMLAVRLTLASGQDLARLIRSHFPLPVALLCWAASELAMVATDLAEVMGAAIALKLLFGLPLLTGAALSAMAAIGLLMLPGAGGRTPDRVIGGLVLVVVGCFAYELILAHPPWIEVARGLVPPRQMAGDPEMLTVALGIIGATLMPHNLYLHSGLARRRIEWIGPAAPRRPLFRRLAIDCWAALTAAGLANMVILAVAATVFGAAHRADAGIEDAYRLIGPVLGTDAAGVVFAVALLAAGQSATATGSMAGQMLIEGFFRLRLSPWLRALVTRAAALALAIGLTAAGKDRIDGLLVGSQVVLGLTLPFVLVPMLLLLRDRRIMQSLPVADPLLRLADALAVALICLNAWLAGTSLA